MAAGLCAGCGALAAAVLGNKRLACVAVVDVGMLPSIACIILSFGGVLLQLQNLLHAATINWLFLHQCICIDHVPR